MSNRNETIAAVGGAATADILPAAPGTPDLVASYDTGISSTDNITSYLSPSFSGGGAESGATVSLLDSDGATLLGTAVADASGNWTLSTTLTEGVHSLTATQLSPSGASSGRSATLTVTVDTTPPDASALTVPVLAKTSDTGSSDTDGITADTTPTYVGTGAQPGETVVLSQVETVLVPRFTWVKVGSFPYTPPYGYSIQVVSGYTEQTKYTDIGTGVADAAGSWSITLGPLPPQTIKIVASLVDIAGNVGTHTSVTTTTITDKAPSVAFTLQYSAGKLSLLAGPPPTVTTFTVRDGGKAIATYVATTSGNVDIPLPLESLAPGPHRLSVAATNTAGNTTPATPLPFTFELGTSGNDVLAGTKGPDRFIGLAGDDTYIVNHAFDVINEGDDGGTDLVITSVDYDLIGQISTNPGGATVQIEGLAAAPGALGLNLAGNSFHNVILGGAGDDNILARSGNDIAYGNDGRDTIDGGYGIDSLFGGNGDDVLRGGADADLLDGGDGRDEATYYFDDGSPGGGAGVLVDLAAGIARDGFGKLDWLKSIQNVSGTSSASPDVPGVSDVLLGNGEDNIFRGLGGVDHIDGRGGADTVDHSQDYDAGGSSGVAVNLAAGFAIDGFGANDILISIENAIGTDHPNLLLTGYSDLLVGSASDNTLDGRGGDDILDGGDGHDTLIGGAGIDIMTGGTGNDIFVIDAAGLVGGEYDLITDFTLGADSIRATLAMQGKTVFTAAAGGVTLLYDTGAGIYALNAQTSATVAQVQAATSYI